MLSTIKIKLIMVHIFTVYATIFLLALHVSNRKGHHQVLSTIYHLLLSYNAIFLHFTITYTYTGHNQSLSFFLYIFGGVTWLCPSSSILENTTFRKLDLFPSPVEVGRHLPCWFRWKELTPITGDKG
jgi:hypothetical protein